MLSNPLHRFSPYHTLPSSTLLSNGHHPSSHLHATGLDTLAQGSHYALQQLQQHVGVHNPHLARPGPQQKHRQHPYGPAARATGVAGPIRRRISRACDQCNQLRTKCDGQHPCAHCIGKCSRGSLLPIIRARTNRGRIWTRVRVHPREEEARQGIAKGSCPASSRSSSSSGRSSQWPEVTNSW
jgi:xylanolytic transcriptional activator XlnR